MVKNTLCHKPHMKNGTGKTIQEHYSYAAFVMSQRGSAKKMEFGLRMENPFVATVLGNIFQGTVKKKENSK